MSKSTDFSAPLSGKSVMRIGQRSQSYCGTGRFVEVEEVRMLGLCNFFKRTRYYRIMPKYHAIRIRQEERYQPAGGFLPPRHKKQWVTSWQGAGRYY